MRIMGVFIGADMMWDAKHSAAVRGSGMVRSIMVPTVRGHERPPGSDPYSVLGSGMMEAQFVVIKEARSWLAQQVKTRADEGTRQPSATTVAGYRREMVRLAATGDPWKAAADTTKKATFFARRASILHFCRANVEEHLKAQDHLQRNNGLLDPVKKEAWMKHVKVIQGSLKLAQKAPDEVPIKKVDRRESKKKDLWKLPTEWREILAKRMPRYREAVAITALCGCRPQELANGVTVSVLDGELKIRILGVKVGKDSGQEWRELVWKLPSENPLAILLGRVVMQKVGVKGGQIIAKIDDPRAFSGAVRAAGCRAFPGFPHAITPYSMRHQVASDMKNAGLGDDISAALGHAVSDTRSGYGAWELGCGSMAPDRIESARAVKVKPPYQEALRTLFRP